MVELLIAAGLIVGFVMAVWGWANERRTFRGWIFGHFCEWRYGLAIAWIGALIVAATLGAALGWRDALH